MSSFTRFVFTGVVLTLATSGIYAQNSEISGRILDPTQASVQTAVAVLTRADTGDRRETVSSAEGYYAFPSLTPGVYDLTVQKEGFRSQTSKGIVVETGEVSSVDVTLELGDVSQSVTVDASVAQLQTESAAVSHVVTNDTIVNMPLIDRRSTQLTRLNGFVVQVGGGSSTAFAIAGGRGGNANFYVDGGSVENVAMGVPTLYFDPPVEAMQEFNVTMSTYAAELGRTGGGIFQMSTKSGTNQFHGSAYEYFRNDVLNLNTYFAASKPTLRYNLFGASFGGPIRKNKTHFFFNYEGKRQVTESTVNLLVPTPAELSGNFSSDKFVLKDPGTGLAFPGNIIPATRLDTVGLNLAKFYPAPNYGGGGGTNFLANQPQTTVVNNYVARVDHVINDNNRIFVRFLGQPDHTLTGPVFAVAAADPSAYLLHNYYYNGAVTWNRNFSPTLLNEFRLVLGRRQTLNISPGANSAAAAEIGLKGAAEPSYFPGVILTGYANLGQTSGNGQLRFQTPVEAHQLSDNVTKVVGAHQIKFGGEYRYGKDGEIYNPAAGGVLTFNSLATGNSIASMLLGWVNQGTVLSAYPLHSRLDTYGFFVQDDWKVTPRLTLNLGLRYDFDTPRWEIHNRQNGFDPDAINPVSGTPGVITFAGINGQSQYAHNWDLNNFGPRLGFAWKAADNWVIRGGGGILYTGEYDIAAPVVLYTGFATLGTFVAGNNGAIPAFILQNGFPQLSSPTPADLTPGYGAVNVGQAPTTSVTYFEKDRQTGFLYQTSLDIQHDLGKGILLDIGYLGTFGHHLPATVPQSINQVPTAELGPGNLQPLRPFPQFSNVQILGSDLGKSNYNGVSLSVDKRLSGGLQFKASYTYSKFLDNLVARSELGGGLAFTNFYNQANDWGRSGNDLRHRVVVSSIYQLPFGTNKLFQPSSRFLNAVIGGWSVGAIMEAHTGPPLSPSVLTNQTNSYSDGVRPNVVGNPDTGPQTISRWFNTSAFALPAPYTFGNAGRTFGTGPGFFNLDGSLLKDFSIERFALQFRAEVLNLTNHPNFSIPNTQDGSSTFGQITTLVAGNQARIIQLGLHFQF
ncbi:MAG: TonB-dependent receptor [Bryobacterales bacterium]|nr:TonB-dependent receptor [Bryobacterales bacterium]